MIEPKFKHDPRGSTWIERGACIEEDPELFFPVGTSGPAMEQAERAKAVCRSCPVLGECLRWSLDTCQDAGVWGGLDEEERRVIRRRRRREAAERTAAARAAEDPLEREIELTAVAG
jgi:WhiB family transcriptional regulator, redox-sensing transcriptional regulator